MLQELLTTSNIVGILGLFITLIGTVIGVYSLVKTKKEISFDRYGYKFIDKETKKSIEKLKVEYDGISVDDISISKVNIFNSGNTTINNEDIAKADPIVISIKNGENILGYNIIHRGTLANSTDLSKNKNGDIVFNFDFLDRNDGILLDIIHTGITDDIEITGTIKGSKGIKEKTRKDSINIFDVATQVAYGVFIVIFYFHVTNIQHVIVSILLNASLIIGLFMIFRPIYLLYLVVESSE